MTVLNHTHRKNFQQTFIIHDFVSTCKKLAISSFCSRDKLIYKSSSLIDQENLGPYARNQAFLEYRICIGILQTMGTIVIDQIQKKSKNIFTHFLGQKNFLSINLAKSNTTWYGILTTFQNLEKTNNLIPR